MPRRGHRVLRWIGRIAAGLVVFVMLAVLGIGLALHVSPVQGLVREQVEHQLAKTFVGGGTVGEITGSPFTELVVHDLVIDGPDHRPAITIGALHVKLRLAPLVKHRLVISKLVADDLEVIGRRDAHGQLQLAHLQRPSKPGTWSVELPSLAVHRGHVALETGSGMLDLDHLEIGAAASLPHGGPIDVGIAASGVWRQRRAPIGVAAVLHRGPEGVELPLVAGALSDLEVAASGVRIPPGGRGPIAGDVWARAPASTVAALAHVRLPGDVTLALAARPAGDATEVELAGTLGRGTLNGALRADVAARRVAGFVGGSRLDLGALWRGKLEGTGDVFAALEAAPGKSGELPHARGIVQAWGHAAGAPPTDVAIAVDVGGDGVRATVGAANRGGLVVAASAAIRRGRHETILERGVLVAATEHAGRATGGAAPIAGALAARIVAQGRLSPDPDLAASGYVDGSRLRAAGVSAKSLHVRLDAAHLGGHPTGTASLAATGIAGRGVALRQLALTARDRPDGRIAVGLRASPRPAPWQVAIDALVTVGKTPGPTRKIPGKTIDIALEQHQVRDAGGAIWRGRGGDISIGPERIVVRDVRSASRAGSLAVSGSYVRAGRSKGDARARFAGSLDLANVSSRYRGRIDARGDVSRNGPALRADVDARAAGVRLDPRAGAAFDASAQVRARPGQLTANVAMKSSGVGGVQLALDVAAPRALANRRAWQALPRSAIRQARIELDHVDLAALARAVGARHAAAASQPDRIGGQVAGALELTAHGANGSLHLRDVHAAPLRAFGALFADLQLAAPAPGELAVTTTARLGGGGALGGDADLVVPAHPFDATAWRALGPKALRGANVHADALPIAPGMLARTGTASKVRGSAWLSARLGPALSTAQAALELRDLHGGVLARPVTVRLAGKSGAAGTQAMLSVSQASHLLLDARARVPLSLAQLRSDPRAARGAPLVVHGEVPAVPVALLLGALGNTQVTGGTLAGTVEVGGTLGRPTARASFVARDVTVPPGMGGAPVQAMRELQLNARWDGHAASVVVDGQESENGRLRIVAAGPPSDLAQMTATLDARHVGLAPLVAFLPGPAGGLGGELDAHLTVHGLAARTTKLAGNLHITQGRVPIAPQIGTLFHGDIAVTIGNQAIDVRAAGKLGNGDLKLVGSAPIATGTPTGGRLELTVRHIQLIGKTQPIVDAQVTAKVGRTPDHWQANIDVRRALVTIPSSKGHPLAPASVPKDIYYASPTGKAPPETPVASSGPHAPPAHPSVIASIDLHDVRVESKEARGTIVGKLSLLLGGKQLGLLGTVQFEHGDVELFDRRYQVDRALAQFDGSPDPRLDVRITHDFTDVTTITEVRGRASKPKLVLTSQPAIYSKAELLGFLLGGEPNGDPNQAPSARQRVESAAGSYLANQVGGYIKQALPFDIDVFRYEASSASSSAAITVGTWVSHDLFFAYKQHLEARPDENAGEGEIEYWLERRLVLQATIGDRGYDGIDLLWRHHW